MPTSLRRPVLTSANSNNNNNNPLSHHHTNHSSNPFLYFDESRDNNNNAAAFLPSSNSPGAPLPLTSSSSPNAVSGGGGGLGRTGSEGRLPVNNNNNNNGSRTYRTQSSAANNNNNNTNTNNAGRVRTSMSSPPQLGLTVESPQHPSSSQQQQPHFLHYDDSAGAYHTHGAAAYPGGAVQDLEYSGASAFANNAPFQQESGQFLNPMTFQQGGYGGAAGSASGPFSVTVGNRSRGTSQVRISDGTSNPIIVANRGGGGGASGSGHVGPYRGNTSSSFFHPSNQNNNNNNNNNNLGVNSSSVWHTTSNNLSHNIPLMASLIPMPSSPQSAASATIRPRKFFDANEAMLLTPILSLWTDYFTFRSIMIGNHTSSMILGQNKLASMSVLSNASGATMFTQTTMLRASIVAAMHHIEHVLLNRSLVILHSESVQLLLQYISMEWNNSNEEAVDKLLWLIKELDDFFRVTGELDTAAIPQPTTGDRNKSHEDSERSQSDTEGPPGGSVGGGDDDVPGITGPIAELTMGAKAWLWISGKSTLNQTHFSHVVRSDDPYAAIGQDAPWWLSDDTARPSAHYGGGHHHSHARSSTSYTGGIATDVRDSPLLLLLLVGVLAHLVAVALVIIGTVSSNTATAVVGAVLAFLVNTALAGLVLFFVKFSTHLGSGRMLQLLRGLLAPSGVHWFDGSWSSIVSWKRCCQKSREEAFGYQSRSMPSRANNPPRPEQRSGDGNPFVVSDSPSNTTPATTTSGSNELATTSSSPVSHAKKKRLSLAQWAAGEFNNDGSQETVFQFVGDTITGSGESTSRRFTFAKGGASSFAMGGGPAKMRSSASGFGGRLRSSGEGLMESNTLRGAGSLTAAKEVSMAVMQSTLRHTMSQLHNVGASNAAPMNPADFFDHGDRGGGGGGASSSAMHPTSFLPLVMLDMIRRSKLVLMCDSELIINYCPLIVIDAMSNEIVCITNSALQRLSSSVSKLIGAKVPQIFQVEYLGPAKSASYCRPVALKFLQSKLSLHAIQCPAKKVVASQFPNYQLDPSTLNQVLSHEIAQAEQHWSVTAAPSSMSAQLNNNGSSRASPTTQNPSHLHYHHHPHHSSNTVGANNNTSSEAMYRVFVVYLLSDIAAGRDVAPGSNVRGSGLVSPANPQPVASFSNPPLNVFQSASAVFPAPSTEGLLQPSSVPMGSPTSQASAPMVRYPPPPPPLLPPPSNPNCPASTLAQQPPPPSQQQQQQQQCLQPHHTDESVNIDGMFTRSESPPSLVGDAKGERAPDPEEDAALLTVQKELQEAAPQLEIDIEPHVALLMVQPLAGAQSPAPLLPTADPPIPVAAQGDNPTVATLLPPMVPHKSSTFLQLLTFFLNSSWDHQFDNRVAVAPPSHSATAAAHHHPRRRSSGTKTSEEDRLPSGDEYSSVATTAIYSQRGGGPNHPPHPATSVATLAPPLLDPSQANSSNNNSSHMPHDANPIGLGPLRQPSSGGSSGGGGTNSNSDNNTSSNNNTLVELAGNGAGGRGGNNEGGSAPFHPPSSSPMSSLHEYDNKKVAPLIQSVRVSEADGILTAVWSFVPLMTGMVCQPVDMITTTAAFPAHYASSQNQKLSGALQGNSMLSVGSQRPPPNGFDSTQTPSPQAPMISDTVVLNSVLVAPAKTSSINNATALSLSTNPGLGSGTTATFPANQTTSNSSHLVVLPIAQQRNYPNTQHPSQQPLLAASSSTQPPTLPTTSPPVGPQNNNNNNNNFNPNNSISNHSNSRSPIGSNHMVLGALADDLGSVPRLVTFGSTLPTHTHMEKMGTLSVTEPPNALRFLSPQVVSSLQSHRVSWRTDVPPSPHHNNAPPPPPDGTAAGADSGKPTNVDPATPRGLLVNSSSSGGTSKVPNPLSAFEAKTQPEGQAHKAADWRSSSDSSDPASNNPTNPNNNNNTSHQFENSHVILRDVRLARLPVEGGTLVFTVPAPTLPLKPVSSLSFTGNTTNGGPAGSSPLPSSVPAHNEQHPALPPASQLPGTNTTANAILSIPPSQALMLAPSGGYDPPGVFIGTRFSLGGAGGGAAKQLPTVLATNNPARDDPYGVQDDLKSRGSFGFSLGGMQNSHAQAQPYATSATLMLYSSGGGGSAEAVNGAMVSGGGGGGGMGSGSRQKVSHMNSIFTSLFPLKVLMYSTRHHDVDAVNFLYDYKCVVRVYDDEDVFCNSLNAMISLFQKKEYLAFFQTSSKHVSGFDLLLIDITTSPQHNNAPPRFLPLLKTLLTSMPLQFRPAIYFFSRRPGQTPINEDIPKSLILTTEWDLAPHNQRLAIEKAVTVVNQRKNQKLAMDVYVGGEKAPKYVLGRRLGSGGFGDVFEVQLEISGGLLAMKRVFIGADSGGGQTRRTEDVRREIHLMSLVDHPNVVKLSHSVTEEDECVCIFMELCDGSLTDYLRSGGVRLDPTVKYHPASITASSMQIVRVVNDILSGVHALHSQGIVHRDLKPDNVLFREGIAKLSDLGAAAKEPSPTSPSSRGSSTPSPATSPSSTHITGGGTNNAEAKFVKMRGTLGFMAPEVVLGEPYGRAVDIWAVGCILAELLGVPLFHLVHVTVPKLTELFATMGPTLDIEAVPLSLRSGGGGEGGGGGKSPAPRFFDSATSTQQQQQTQQSSIPARVSFPPPVVELLKSCFTLDAGRRATIDTLLRHPVAFDELWVARARVGVAEAIPPALYHALQRSGGGYAGAARGGGGGGDQASNARMWVAVDSDSPSVAPMSFAPETDDQHSFPSLPPSAAMQQQQQQQQQGFYAVTNHHNNNAVTTSRSAFEDACEDDADNDRMATVQTQTFVSSINAGGGGGGGQGLANSHLRKAGAGGGGSGGFLPSSGLDQRSGNRGALPSLTLGQGRAVVPHPMGVGGASLYMPPPPPPPPPPMATTAPAAATNATQEALTGGKLNISILSLTE